MTKRRKDNGATPRAQIHTLTQTLKERRALYLRLYTMFISILMVPWLINKLFLVEGAPLTALYTALTHWVIRWNPLFESTVESFMSLGAHPDMVAKGKKKMEKILVGFREIARMPGASWEEMDQVLKRPLIAAQLQPMRDTWRTGTCDTLRELMSRLPTHVQDTLPEDLKTLCGAEGSALSMAQVVEAAFRSLPEWIEEIRRMSLSQRMLLLTLDTAKTRNNLLFAFKILTSLFALYYIMTPLLLRLSLFLSPIEPKSPAPILTAEQEAEQMQLLELAVKNTTPSVNRHIFLARLSSVFALFAAGFMYLAEKDFSPEFMTFWLAIIFTGMRGLLSEIQEWHKQKQLDTQLRKNSTAWEKFLNPVHCGLESIKAQSLSASSIIISFTGNYEHNGERLSASKTRHIVKKVLGSQGVRIIDGRGKMIIVSADTAPPVSIKAHLIEALDRTCEIQKLERQLKEWLSKAKQTPDPSVLKIPSTDKQKLPVLACTFTLHPTQVETCRKLFDAENAFSVSEIDSNTAEITITGKISVDPKALERSIRETPQAPELPAPHDDHDKLETFRIRPPKDDGAGAAAAAEPIGARIPQRLAQKIDFGAYGIFDSERETDEGIHRLRSPHNEQFSKTHFILFAMTPDDFGRDHEAAYGAFRRLAAEDPHLVAAAQGAQGWKFRADRERPLKGKLLGLFGNYRVYARKVEAKTGEELFVVDRISLKAH